FAHTVFDRDIFPIGDAGLAQASAKRTHTERIRAVRPRAEETDHGHPRLLRARRERPHRRSATEQRDELAALHSITSSARASSLGGTSTFSSLAALRLVISSTLVTCWTGRLPGRSPLRIRPA